MPWRLADEWRMAATMVVAGLVVLAVNVRVLAGDPADPLDLASTGGAAFIVALGAAFLVEPADTDRPG
jgi:hypothetical protein